MNILGTEYTLFEDNIDDPELKPKDRAGYCFFDAKEIHIENLETDKDWIGESEIAKKRFKGKLLRHEIIHAFLYESGLNADSSDIEAWATSEEMVDWIAIQMPKIIETCRSVGAL